MDGFQIGNDRPGGKRSAVQVLDDPLDHGRRRCGNERRHLPERPVPVVFRLIKRRHVNTRQLGQLPQQPVAAAAASRLFPAGDGSGKFADDLLAFADYKTIEEIGQRLRIVGAGAAAHDQGIGIGAVGAGQRNAAQIQHRQDVGIGHFILQGEAHRVKLPENRPGLQTGQGSASLPHRLFHIRPGAISPLGVGVGAVVQNSVQNLQAKIGHAHFIDVGQSQSKTNGHGGRVLADLVPLAAGITGRLGHGRQQGVDGILHGFLHFQNINFCRRDWILSRMPMLTRFVVRALTP